MAFGKPPEPKVWKISPNIEDQLWKANVRSEDVASEKWQIKWGWILGEYKQLRNQLDEATRNSTTLPVVIKTYHEMRTTKPLPNSEAHVCGWIAAKKEFKLEKYGSDVYKGLPFVSLSGVQKLR